MADSETPAADDAGEAKKKKKGLPPAAIPAIATILGIGAGGFVGAAVLAPSLTHGIGTGVVSAAELSVDQAGGKKKKAADDHAEDDEEHADEEHADGEEGEEEEEDGEKKTEKEGEHGPAAPQVYTVADMVLNPAGSGGQRFVMLTVAMEAKDSATVALLQGRDPEIRDAILALVGGKTVEELAEVAAREPLKTEIMATVARITKKKKGVKRVSFPQFVIQ
jgi:flagellar FliL protein